MGVLGALSACGNPDYQYISNAQESLFFRVPYEWQVYRMTEKDKEGRPAPLPAGIERSWHVVVDAAAQPTPDNVNRELPESPVIDAQVYALSSYNNDTMSQSKLREVMFGFDPLLQDPGVPKAWEVVGASELAFEGGVVGTRVVINAPSKDDPTKFYSRSGSTMFDPATGRIYLLAVTCEAQCYLDNQRLIDDVASSWTVNRT